MTGHVETGLLSYHLQSTRPTTILYSSLKYKKKMCKIDSECHPNITAMQINLELYLETLFTDVLTQRFGC